MLWHHSRTPLSTKQPTRPRADARARLHARERHRTRAHARGSGSTFTRHSLRLSVSRAIRRAEPAFRLTGGHIPAKGREMKPVSVTPTLAPREADDTAICARASLAGPSGYGHRSAASPPAARDGRGRLRRDGPGAGLRILQRSVVFVATPFALDARVARRPGAPGVGRRAGDDLRGRGCPGLRSRTRQGLSKTDADDERRWCRVPATRQADRGTDGAADDDFGYSVSIDGDTMVIGASGRRRCNSGSAYVFTRDTAGDLASGWTQVAKLTAGRRRCG